MAIEYRNTGKPAKPEVRKDGLRAIIERGEVRLADAEKIPSAPPPFSGRREVCGARVRPDVIQALKGMDGDYAKHVEQALIEYAQKAGVL
jgi:hypothetical protein